MDVASNSADALLKEIAEHPFLRGMKQEHLALLADCSMRSHFAKDERIFRAGDPANRFYLLQKGKVALESPSDGSAKTVQLIGAGDVLGWSWLFPPYTWHFDARAVEPTEAIFFYATRVRELCDSSHDFGYRNDEPHRERADRSVNGGSARNGKLKLSPFRSLIQ